MITPLPAKTTWWFWSLALGLPAVLAASLAIAVADDPSTGRKAGVNQATSGPAAFGPPIPAPSGGLDEGFFPESTGEEVDPNGDLVVVDSGFSTYATASGPAYSYAAVIENPTDARADVVRIRTLLLDDEGTVLLTDERFVQSVEPGTRVAVGSEAPEDLEIATIEIRTEVDAWRTPTADPVTITASDVETVETEFDVLKTTAKMSSDATTDLSDIELTAVYRNDDGEIIGGTPGYLEYLPAGAAAVATIQSGSVIPGVASTDVIATSSGFPTAVAEAVPAPGRVGASVDVDG